MEINKDSLEDIDLEVFKLILKDLPSNIFLKDIKCRYIFASHYWRHLKMDDENIDWDIKGKTDLEIRKDKDNARKAYEEDQKIISTGIGVDYEIKIEQDGETEYFQIIKNPIFDKNGKIIGIVGLINDITKRVIYEQMQEEKAKIDEMTGVYNRSYYENFINTFNLESVYPLSIIVADCNNLKKINDSYGHLVGDEYIRKSATILSIMLPDEAIIFRIGGDEFLALLPNTTEEVTKEYINRMNEISSSIIVADLPISIAFGSTTVEKYNKDIRDNIEEADKEMYKVKQLMKRS